MFVYDPKAHRRAPGLAQVPASEKTKAPEETQALSIAPLTTSNSNEQTPLAKPKFVPAPVTNPNPKPSTEQR